MCTAYELGKRGGSFPARLKNEATAALLQLPDTALIRPTLQAPVILPDGQWVTMRWGFRREFAPRRKGGKPLQRTIVNSRENKLAGATWRDSFARRRCLIPAASFYEWVELRGRKYPLRFQRPDEAWIWIAGIWEENASLGCCYSMITTDPNAAVKPVHDRMPAVLDDHQIDDFLDGKLDHLGPSPVELTYQQAPNFLKPTGKPDSPPPTQQELF
jgi:putative SOS response-associated peptidase YedK